MWSSEPQIVLLAETISTTSYFKLPKNIDKQCKINGASDETRTHMDVNPLPPEDSVSTNSTTDASK